MKALICIAVFGCVALGAFGMLDFPDNTFAVGAPMVANGGYAIGAPMVANGGFAAPMGMQMGYPQGVSAGMTSSSGGLSPLLALLLLSNGSLFGTSSSTGSTSSTDSLVQIILLLSLFGGNTSGGALLG